jgi:hypothetical protein
MAGALCAQETPRVAFNVGGGFTNPLGRTGSRLNNGWNVGAGLGFNFSPYVGALVQFQDNQFDINSATLGTLGFPGGDVNMWSASLNPIIHTNPRGPVDLYFIGGGGLDHWRQEFTAPSIAVFNGFDPFFGFYQAAIPVNQVLTSYSVNKPGVNAGAGLAFGTKWHAKVYAEARWHRMFFGNDRFVDTIPVTFGFRW